MTLRKLYRHPVESAKHTQFKQLCLEYFENHDKLMRNPSMRFARRARKALVQLRKAAYHRGMELLSLYADSYNQGKDIINGPDHKHGVSTAGDHNEEEENHGKNKT